MSPPTPPGTLSKFAGTAAAAAGAALTVGAGPVPAAIAAAVPGLVELVSNALALRNQKRVTDWLELLMQEPRFVELVDAPGETAPMLLAARLEEPGFGELFTRAVKELLGSISSASVAPLALLMREYLRDGRLERGPDDFFRGAAAVLAALDAEQLRALRELVALVAARPEDYPQVEIRQNQLYFATEADSESGHKAEGPSFNQWRRLFHRLKNEALAFDNPAGFFDVVSGPDVLRMERVTAQRLLALIPA